MGVQVNQTGGDNLTAGINDTIGGIGGDVGFHRGDAIAFDGDIEPSVVAGSRVDDCAVFDEKIEVHRRISSFHWF